MSPAARCRAVVRHVTVNLDALEAVRALDRALEWCGAECDDAADCDGVPGSLEQAWGVLAGAREVLALFASGEPCGRFGAVHVRCGRRDCPVCRGAHLTRPETLP